MSTKDGGPAFPCEQSETQNGQWNQSFEPGMTLLDYFAAHASEDDIQSVKPRIPDERRIVEFGDGRKGPIYTAPENWRQIARYLHAQAMLKAREAQ